MPLPEQTQFLIDFNVHDVASALGMSIPEAAAAAMYAISAADYDDYQSGIDNILATTADAYRSAPGLQSLIGMIPAGGSVLCIGDSITTYRYSYARLLGHLFSPHGVSLINRGFSGYTTTHALEMTYTQFLALQPDVVFIKYGVNDCKRFGGTGERTLVSAKDYQDNLRAILRAFQQHTTARIFLLTPTPVVEAVVNANPDIAAMRLIWRNDDLHHFGDLALNVAHEIGVDAVDLRTVFGDPPDAAAYCPDGLHPNAHGQRRMLEYVLNSLASF